MTHSCPRWPKKPAIPTPVLKPVKRILYRETVDQPGQCDVERMVVEQRDAEQGQREEDEIDRDPGKCRAAGGKGW